MEFLVYFFSNVPGTKLSAVGKIVAGSRCRSRGMGDTTSIFQKIAVSFGGTAP
jgi:hypothetical protein